MRRPPNKQQQILHSKQVHLLNSSMPKLPAQTGPLCDSGSKANLHATLSYVYCSWSESRTSRWYGFCMIGPIRGRSIERSGHVRMSIFILVININEFVVGYIGLASAISVVSKVTSYTIMTMTYLPLVICWMNESIRKFARCVLNSVLRGDS